MNNRQAGRRRGRGGQRSQGGNPNRPDNGNRIDNRARGNAAQLLEKYKNLARDAQMQGDRVNTEYYHQFADHYFRVLNESRVRFEENRRQRDDDDDDDFEMEGDAGTPDQPQGERQQDRRGDRDSQRGDRQDRGERRERDERGDRRRERTVAQSNSEGEQNSASDEAANADAPAGEEAPRRRGRPRRQPAVEAASESAETAPSIEADRLPPSLGMSSDGEEEEAPRPRRRRKLRTDGEEAASTADRKSVV